MLTLEQIRSYFPEQVARANPRGVLVEYLQYELLDSLYKLPEAASLSFIGGTAIRMLRQSPRFSEDLDFDNFGLTFGEFEQALQKACRDMELKGFLVEYRMVEKGAYQCHVKFPRILYESGISPDSNEKVLVRVDTERKERFYGPQRFLLNRFTVYRQVLVAPLSILLSQKMMTVMLRKREKGRDVFDMSLLLGVAEPDYDYMSRYLGMEKEQIVEEFTKRVGELDLGYLARDVEPFLFDAGQKERVLTFREYWGQRR